MRSTQVALSATKDRVKVIGAFTPSGGENLGVFNLDVVYVLSFQTAFERRVDYDFH